MKQSPDARANDRYGSFTRSVAAVIAGKSSATITAEALVVRAACAYLGFDTNVNSPGPASSIPLSPLISISEDGFSRRACNAEAIAESFMSLGGDANKSYIICRPYSRRVLFNDERERALLFERPRRSRHRDDVTPRRACPDPADARRVCRLRLRRTTEDGHKDQLASFRAARRLGAASARNHENANERQPTAEQHGIVESLIRAQHRGVRRHRR